MNVKVKDVDRGASYLAKRAAQLANGVEFGVGVPEDAGEYPDGTPVATVAAAHEFGGGNAPQRSFLRGWFDEKGTGFFARELVRMAQNAVIKGTPIEGEIATFGAQSVKEIQERMDAGIEPELEDKTIRAKERAGSATPETPLENTHRLRNAVKWVMRRG